MYSILTSLILVKSSAVVLLKRSLISLPPYLIVEKSGFVVQNWEYKFLLLFFKTLPTELLLVDIYTMWFELDIYMLSTLHLLLNIPGENWELCQSAVSNQLLKNAGTDGIKVITSSLIVLLFTFKTELKEVPLWPRLKLWIS